MGPLPSANGIWACRRKNETRQFSISGSGCFIIVDANTNSKGEIPRNPKAELMSLPINLFKSFVGLRSLLNYGFFLAHEARIGGFPKIADPNIAP